MTFGFKGHETLATMRSIIEPLSHALEVITVRAITDAISRSLHINTAHQLHALKTNVSRPVFPVMVHICTYVCAKLAT